MRLSWGLVIAIGMLAALSGCRRRGPVDETRVLHRYERNLVRLAARDSRCHPQQIQPVRVGQTVWVTNTCTGPREYLLQCRRPERWSGCRWRRVPTVPRSAAPLLQCPEQAISQQPSADPYHRLASGCGQQVSMQLRCHPAGCAWVHAPGAGAMAPVAPPGYGGSPQGAVIYVPAQ